MANELTVIYTGSDSVYCIIQREDTGDVWDVSASAFVNWADVDIDNYDIVMSNLGGDLYGANMPSGITTGVLLRFTYYRQPGANPTISDYVLNTQTGTWNGAQIGGVPASTVLDATVAGVDANSYVTIQEANDYYDTKQTFNVTWSTFTDDQKAAYLIQAAYAIDRYKFCGCRLNEWNDNVTNPQALEFPRRNCEFYQRTDEIDPRVKKAQMEMVLYQYYNQASTTQESKFGNKDVIKASVDQVVSVEFQAYKSEDSEGAALAVGSSLEAVESYLEPWLVDVKGGFYPWER